MSAKTLTADQRAGLRLIERSGGAAEWADVSAQLLPVIRKMIPTELADIEDVGDAGRGRIRLTDKGRTVLEYL